MGRGVSLSTLVATREFKLPFPNRRGFFMLILDLRNIYTYIGYMRQVYQSIRTIPNFPAKGILYRDIQPILKDNELFRQSIAAMHDLVDEVPEYWIGIESRGFIFASALSVKYGGGLVLVRKKGKLPPANKLISEDYGLEYGKDTLQIESGHTGKAILVDDIYATGGTLKAAGHLATRAGYTVAGSLCFLNINIVEPPKDLLSLFTD